MKTFALTAPPYYTMLRAIDSGSASEGAIKAYAQQNSRVWVEIGYRHPLGDRLHPPAGEWLLISRQGSWRFLSEGRFRDVYEILDFTLPESAESLSDTELAERIRIPLRLADGSTQEPAELWVLCEDAMAQVERLIWRSDDQAISRLAFAVVDRQESADPTVVIRARPSKELPPVLVLDGVAFRPYLKIPSLFVPVGRRLHPPLRRDAVVKLLAGQGERIIPFGCLAMVLLAVVGVAALLLVYRC